MSAPEDTDTPQNHHPQPGSVFRGSDLVGWLVERGLCTGRGEAQLYGVLLQRGGVIEHATGQCGFQDEETLLYYFTDESQRWTETPHAQDA